MTDFDAIDFFQGSELLVDPYPYFEALRAECPVRREPHHDVVMVTGYDEAIAGLQRHRDASRRAPRSPARSPGSRCRSRATTSPTLIEQHRDELPMSDQLPTLDPPVHTDHRALLMRLITPKRLKENEEFMWRLADRQLDTFLADGRCEYIGQFASPFALLVIADLLGVPEEDHAEVRRGAAARREADRAPSAAPTRPSWPTPRWSTCTSGSPSTSRTAGASPRDDVLTGLADAPRSPTARRPRSSTSCGSPPTSSPPARRPPCGC